MKPVLVPIQGSVPLVTFISEKPIEQLPFAWCGHPPSGRAKRWLRQNPEQHCEFDSGVKGITKSRNKSGYLDSYRYGPSQKIGMKQNAAGEEGDDERPWADLRYKDWKSAAIRMLQERTFVVVGGIHIQEVIIQPRIANLDCSTLTGGQIDISQLKDGVVNCSVTGSGLGLATEISLEKGNIKIVGKIKAAVDGNSAVLQFKPDDMCAAEGIYSLYLTYKPNSEGDPTRLDSGKSASLGKQASISGAKLAEGTLTITGKCLDQLTDVALTPVGTETPVKGADLSVKSSTEATAKFSNLADKISYFLSYSIKAQQNQPIEAKTVVVTFQQPSGDQNGTPSGTRKTVDPTNTTKTSKATGAKNSKKPR